MRGDVARFIFLFFLVLMNFLSVAIIMLELPWNMFIIQFFVLLGMLIVFSFVMFGVMNRFRWANILLAALFGFFLVDVLYLVNFSNSLVLALICFVSVLGAILSFMRISKTEARIVKISKSKSKEIDEELDDDWKESPKVIYE